MRNVLLWIGRFLTAVVFTTAANAGSINLKWDHSVGGERAFYRVYLGDQPGTYKVALNTPWDHARIEGLLGGRSYYVTVRSVNSIGLESENSPEIRVELPEEKLSVAVRATSSDRTPWGPSSQMLAPATLTFKARVGVPLDELEKIEIWGGYQKPDGSRVTFYQELKEPPFEVEVSEIGGASQFSIVPYLVLKTGLKIQGSVNDGSGLDVRIQPRMPRHLLRVTSTEYPVYPGTPVDLDLLVDDTGMPVRTVVFKRGNTVIGEDSVPPYSLHWIYPSSGYAEVHAEVYYRGIESNVFVPSESIGINHVPHPARVAVEAQGVSAGRVLLRGQLSNCEGLPITKMEFLEGATVIAEDVNPPYEIPWQTTPGKSCEITCRASFGTGHVLASVPIAVTIPERNPDPTIVLRLPAAPGPWTAPATVEMEALVEANGNTVQKVQFMEGTVILCEDTAAPYVFSWSGVAARSTAVSARLFYEGSATIDSSPIPVAVVNPRPTAVVNVSVPNGGWIAPATVAMEAAVNANGNGIQRVQFLEGGTVIGEATASPYRFDWVGVSARSTMVSARVFYGEGLTVDAAPVAVAVVNPRPTAVLNIPVPPGGWSAPASVGMEAIVNANGNVIQRVQFLEQGTVLNEDTTAPYGFLWAGVSPRSTAVSARIFYEGGGVIETAPVSVVVSSGLPPTVVLEVFDANSDFRAPASLTLRAQVDSKGYAIQKVSFLSGGVPIGEATVPPFQMTWSHVAAGAKRIVARATYGGGAVVESSPVNINISDSLPAPWKTIDVGAFSFPGSVETLDDRPVSFLVSGNGALQLGKPTDSFRFVYQPLAGNGEIEATFSAEGGVDGSEVIGLMLRENLGESSPFVFVGIGSTPFLYRQRAGAPSATIPTLPIKATRIGIKRLVKAGGDSLVIRYFDENPASGNPRWINVRNVPGGMVLPRTVYVGIVVASGKPGGMATGLVTNPVVYE